MSDKDFTFERDTINDPFFNSDLGKFVMRAISNDFTIKYYKVDDVVDRCKFPINQISLGLYHPRDEYKIAYSGDRDFVSKCIMRTRNYPFKCIDYLFIENSITDTERNISDYTWCDSPYIDKEFFKLYDIPVNNEFNIIWKTEIFENRELSKVYKQKIRCVPMNMSAEFRNFLDL